jgi:hypothetical protein
MKTMRLVAVIAAMVVPLAAAEAGSWQGYMNVFAKTPTGGPGGYIFGSPWGVADLKTVVVNGSGTGIGNWGRKNSLLQL